MKKNRMMRLASILMIAVLMTTCTISGTFAKYVTEASAGDSARVAKWGVGITATGTTFSEAYDTDDSAATVVSSNWDVGVDASEDKVVAPGTSGTFATVAISGTPEVKVDLTADVDIELSNWTVDGDVYFPLVVEIGGVAVTIDTTSLDTVETSIETAIIKALTVDTVVPATSNTGIAATHRYNANADLVHNVAITWEWPFSVSDANDVLDTALGDQAAAGNAAGISASIAITATQVD